MCCNSAAESNSWKKEKLQMNNNELGHIYYKGHKMSTVFCTHTHTITNRETSDYITSGARLWSVCCNSAADVSNS